MKKIKPRTDYGEDPVPAPVTKKTTTKTAGDMSAKPKNVMETAMGQIPKPPKTPRGPKISPVAQSEFLTRKKMAIEK